MSREKLNSLVIFFLAARMRTVMKWIWFLEIGDLYNESLLEIKIV
ncbi:MAG: hypothetical protein O7F74_08720 [Bacteroidetes bacterium]|nr:hypothetical protein [Bacteroidota bacterium]